MVFPSIDFDHKTFSSKKEFVEFLNNGGASKYASNNLDAAHKACLNHPGRPLLGMSHGPFSGVNNVLGLVAQMERALLLGLTGRAVEK